jgi:hypothetical protein
MCSASVVDYDVVIYRSQFTFEVVEAMNVEDEKGDATLSELNNVAVSLPFQFLLFIIHFLRRNTFELLSINRLD